MPLYQVVVLAVIQALTEFAPVSSSAHLALAPWLFGWKDPGLTFDVALHVGTLAAILIYFFRDWIQIIGQGFGLRAGSDPQLKQNRALLWLLAAGSIPIGVVGFLFGKPAEGGGAQPIPDRHHADPGRPGDVDGGTQGHWKQAHEPDQLG